MRLLALVSGLGLASLASMGGAAHAEWKFSGYTQFRANIWDEALDKDSLDVRRSRFKLEGPLDKLTTLKLQVDVGELDDDVARIRVKDALVTRKLSGQTSAALGLTQIRWGDETAGSSSARLPLERTEASNRLFPAERAAGGWLTYKPTAEHKTLPQVDLALTHGMSRWYERDSSGNKDHDSLAFFARAQWPVRKTGVVGASMMLADRERTISGVNTDFGSENVFGVHARVPVARRFTFQGEYYDGELLDVDVNGWYGTLEYACRRHPATLFYRFDTFDRQMTNDFRRHAGGIGWDFGPNQSQRVTVQAESLDDYAGANFTNYGFQYQVKY